MKITIEYCVPCHYDDKAKEMAEALQGAGHEVELIPSGQGDKVGCFEIVADGKIIHSKLGSSGADQKLESYNWPSAENVIAKLK